MSKNTYSVYGGLEWSATTLTVCTVVSSGQQHLQCVRWFRVVNNGSYSAYGGLDRSATAVTVCTVV